MPRSIGWPTKKSKQKCTRNFLDLEIRSIGLVDEFGSNLILTHKTLHLPRTVPRLLEPL